MVFQISRFSMEEKCCLSWLFTWLASFTRGSVDDVIQMRRPYNGGRNTKASEGSGCNFDVDTILR